MSEWRVISGEWEKGYSTFSYILTVGYRGKATQGKERQFVETNVVPFDAVPGCTTVEEVISRFPNMKSVAVSRAGYSINEIEKGLWNPWLNG